MIIYNIQTGKAQPILAKFLTEDNPIKSVAFSSDGSQLVVGAQKAEKDGTVGMVWNVQVDSDNHTLQVKGDGYALKLRDAVNAPVNQIVVYNKGTTSFVIGAGAKNSYGRWKYTEGRGYVGTGAQRSFSSSITNMAVFQNQSFLAVGALDGSVRLHNLQGTAPLDDVASVKGANPVVAVGFSSTVPAKSFGTLVKIDTKGFSTYTITGLGGGKFETKEDLKQIAIDNKGVVSATVSEDFVFITGKDGTVRVYSTLTGKPKMADDKPIILR